MSTLVPRPEPTPPTRIIVQPSAAASYDQRQQVREHVRQLAHWLDSAFVVPGTKFRVGLDAILGLLPVVGDLIAMAIGGYMILLAGRMNVPRSVIIRMFLNLGTDTVLGSVPVAGDVLDAAWRANSRNARLLERALENPKGVGRSSWWMIAGLSLLLIGLLVGSIVVAVLLAKWLWSLF